ncbi:TetR/AcrR family transcriptional regulator, partial [Aquamicrobium sp. LC103]|uniref:TetR/AcrR family transcriptional regulator n=1 Tax=Aquamicrobium sp. LC103 TaxID=1120658 RepID=UPI0010C9494E
ERMLQAASELIAEGGSDAMKMSDVAERAGVPIGSVYQFFPDKAAIVWTLAERSHAESRKCIEEGLAAAATTAELRAAFSALFDTYYGLFLAEPTMRDIWTAMQADKALSVLEMAESRKNGAILAAALERVSPDADPVRLETSAFLIMHLGEAAVRLAISAPRGEGDRIVEAYKAMADRELARA